MRFRLPFAVACLVAVAALPPVAFGTGDAEYAAVTTRIFGRIGALKSGSQALDWAEEIKRAKVGPDGAGAFSLQRDVEWVLERPSELPGKLNGSRPVYRPGGFWIRLTFYRGSWEGAAVFKSVDFGDLHLWFDYGYKDDASAIRAIAKIVEEERRAFEKALQSKASEPNQPTNPARSSGPRG